MRWILIVAAALALGACDEMARQPRYATYDDAAPLTGKPGMPSPPPGAVAREDVTLAVRLAERPPMTLELLARGRDRYGVYCVPCHDPSGSGRGVVPARGFPRPPSFHTARLRAAPSGHIVDVITHGHGVMYSYADRIAPRDRWAIAAYVRALQISGSSGMVREASHAP